MTETLADRIQQRLDALGLSERAASLKATGSDATIRMIRTGKSREPRDSTLEALAKVLDTNLTWLKYGADAAEPIASTTAAHPNEVRPTTGVPLPFNLQLPKDMPVLGAAAASELGNGSFQLTTDIVDHVRRPPGLMGVPDAYALYVEGDSMSPKFEPGDIVFVHPHRRARAGDYVVIQQPDLAAGETRAFIKRLVSAGPTVLRVKQFNPVATIDFPISRGLVWHKVILNEELYSF